MTGQEFNADLVFEQAREAAFAGQRERAIELCQKILDKHPEYLGVRVFLGRVYAWEKNYDKARLEIQKVLSKDRDNLEALYTIVDVEYWSKNYQQGIKLANRGLQYYPNDQDLLYKKALMLQLNGQEKKSIQTLNTLLKIAPSHAKAQELSQKMKSGIDYSHFGVTYRYSSLAATEQAWRFGNLKSDQAPWHLAALQYSRKMGFGDLLWRLNYANRFEKHGLQYELDCYPVFRPGTYSYLSLGYSGATIFPEFRAGAEVYQALPAALESSMGWRYMQYSTTNLHIFTVSMAKYYRQYWINLRSFITPENKGFSSAWFINLRRYLNSPDNYLSVSLGYGVSPDNLLSRQQIDYLSSKKIILGGQHNLSNSYILRWQCRLENDETSVDQFQKHSSIELSLFYQL